MPQSVPTLLHAPPAPVKNLSGTKPPKPRSDSETSFHDALNQIKKKLTTPSTTTHKPPVAAKPAAKPAPHKSAATSKKAKPVTDKSSPSKPAQPPARKPATDDTTEDSQHDPHPDSHDSADPSAEAPEDQTTAAVPATDSSDVTDPSVPPIAQMTLAAQQAAAVEQPVVDSAADSNDDHDHHDHNEKKDSDSATASSDSNPDAATIAGQLTPQAITAIKQTSDQPTPKNSAQDQTQNQDDAPTAPQVAQATTTTKARAREVQSAKPQPSESNAQSPDPTASQTSAQPADATTPDNTTPTPKTTAKTIEDVLNKSAAAEGLIESPTTPKADPPKAAASPQAPQRPELRFAESNHPTIVSEIQGKLLPSGGSMDIHLTPQDLGSVHVHVEVRDGAITASFQAADDQTAKLLSHSLNDLKSALEAQGINVEKLHVTHTPQDQQPSQNQDRNPHRDLDRQQQQAFHQEQQRRDMMRRMWRRLMKNPDPLDLMA